MHCSEQDQINQLESKVDRLLRRLEQVEIELNELKNLNQIVSDLEKTVQRTKQNESSKESLRVPRMPRMV